MTASAREAWTNASVLAWAQGRDPLVVAGEVAEALRARAESLDLAGPPFDILGLVRSENIALRPANEIGDAQIEASDGNADSPLTISYNPLRPRGRLRFNIAHELAHAQFADVRDQLRRRTPSGAVASAASDAWELELLCNLIASDLLIPVEGMVGVANSSTDIDFLMEQRRRWDVSTEAILRRYVSLVPRSMALVAGTRITASSVRIDYVYLSNAVGQSDPLRGIKHGDFVGNEASLLGTIVAVGQTARGSIAVDGLSYQAQAVGAPPYPGSRSSRVLALLEPENNAVNPLIEHVLGDLTDVEDEKVLFVQVSSDSVRAWSRMGVGARLTSRFPDLATSYRMWTLSDPSHLRLGSAHIVGRPDGARFVTIATLVAQEGFGTGKGQLRYDALATGLEHVRAEAERSGAVVHVPRIGAGQAGGRWDFIENLLVERLADRGIRVVVHTKPHEGAPQ